MDIGTSIFASVALICVIALIIALRGKVRWPRFFLYTLLTIGVLALGVYIFNLPILWRGKIDELEGLKLGESEDDLLFKKGTYAHLCKGLDGGVEYAFVKEEYGKQKVTTVSVVDKAIRQISKSVDYSISWDWRNTVFSYDDEDSIREKFGKEDFITSTTKSYRMYFWRDYNLKIGLNENKVSSVAVFDPLYFYSTPDWRSNYKFSSDCYDFKGNKVNYFDMFKKQ